jgi:hypothetical protein
MTGKYVSKISAMMIQARYLTHEISTTNSMALAMSYNGERLATKL